MNPHKALNSGHRYFCQESIQTFINHPGSKNVTSWKEMIREIKEGNAFAITKETETWLQRARNAMENFELVESGGDLNPTDEYRVLRGKIVVQGSYKDCQKWIDGNSFKFLKNGVKVNKGSDWDTVIDEDGNAASSISELTSGCYIERKYYDSVDDITLWKTVTDNQA